MSALPVRSQTMEALGTMAGSIAHDFNSMLGPIMGYGELAQQCVGEGSPLHRYLDFLFKLDFSCRNDRCEAQP
jgi:hypothetical protein